MAAKPVMDRPDVDAGDEASRLAAADEVNVDVELAAAADEPAAAHEAALGRAPAEVEVPPEEQYTWDICLVFAVGDAEKTVEVRLDRVEDDGGVKERKARKKARKEKRRKRAAGEEEDEEEEDGEGDGRNERAASLERTATSRRKPGEKTAMSQVELFRLTTLNTLERLEAAGLKTSVYHSVQDDEVYCLVGATEERLRREADRVDFDLELDADRTVEEGARVGVKLCTAVKRGEVSAEGWHRLYAKYDPDQMSEEELADLAALNGGQAPKHALLPDNPDAPDPPDRVHKARLYRRYEEGPRHPRTLFRTVDRLKLIDNIIEADPLVGGAGFSPEGLAENKMHSGIAYFPLHQDDRREELVREWLNPRNVFNQPLEKIRDYYGEKVAIYFAFLGFYLRQLIVPGFVGLGMFVWQMVEGKVDVDGVPFYAVFVALWATFLLEMWKREQSVLRVEWGQSAFHNKEQPRPQFWGEVRRSPVTGFRETEFSFVERVKRAMVSQMVIWVLIIVVVGSVFAIFILRKVAAENWGNEGGALVTAVVNAIMIQVLNAVYGVISVKLNDFENHRTATEYENALIAKSFLFKFVNSYNSLFYIAFFKKHDDFVDGCVDDDCLGELQIQLGTIFITMIVIGNATELLTPMVKAVLAARANRAVSDDGDGIPDEVRKSPAEEQFELSPYESTFDDFDELAIQYGFVSLFVLAFPLAPFLALVNNIVEVQVDARKLAHHTRRPEPSGASDIGTWYAVFDIVGVISVLTNLALIVFTTDPVDRWADESDLNKVWVFLVAEHVVFLLKVVIAAAVPDEPGSVTEHELRQEYLQSVMIQGAAEEDEAEDLAAVGDVAHDEEAWCARTRGKAEALHGWNLNSDDALRDMARFTAAPDERQEWVSPDGRMCLQLRKSMQEQCVGGGYNLQPPAFWMLYDLFYLGAIFSAQRVWIEYEGNDQLTEADALALIQGGGGVRELAFADERFAAFMQWWAANRQPRWAIFLNVDDNAITTEWMSERVPQVEPTVEWRFNLDLEDGVIVVRPDPW